MTPKQVLRVLIVDDQDTVCELTRLQLETIGHKVLGKAKNGKEAIEYTKSLHPDVVLMDIEMPEMNGLEATRIIQEQIPTPVVLLTSYENPEFVQEASQIGAGAYLVKPPTPRELERTLIIAIARFSDLMELRRLNTELKAAVDNVKVLSNLLPICSHCKRIRNDEGYWEAVESYLSSHSNAQFSHCLCPSCIDSLYPDYISKKK